MITTTEDKKGSIPYNMKKSLEFISVIDCCGLIDLGFSGYKFTWCNNMGLAFRIWKRLDRAMVNDKWFEAIPITTITHLSSTGFNHCSLVMEMSTKPDHGVRYF